MKDRGFCPRCGRPVRGGNESGFETFFLNGSLVYRHVTCPISDALAALPAISADQAGSDYLTVAEAAALLRVSVSTVRLRIRTGMLPAKRLRGGQTVLVRRLDAEGLLCDVHALTPPPLPPADPARLDAPANGPDIDRTAIVGEVLGGLALAEIPTRLLTRRPFDRAGNYPGGYAGYKAEAAELDRRTRAKPDAATATR